MSRLLDNDRFEYLHSFVFGTPEAKEWLQNEINRAMSGDTSPTKEDPNCLVAVRNMAVLEFLDQVLTTTKRIEDHGKQHSGAASVNTTINGDGKQPD
jgi:hypothetical protein